MSVSSNRILNTVIAAGSMQMQRRDPMLRIGATLESMYAVGDDGRVPAEFSNLLERMDVAQNVKKAREHDER